MNRKSTKTKKAPAMPKAAADRTLHIEWPWSMTWISACDLTNLEDKRLLKEKLANSKAR